MWRPYFLLLLFVLAVSAPGPARAQAADTNTPAPASRADETNTETLRSYLQLQEQLHATQLAIERNRKEAEAAAAETALRLNGRLDAIEKNFSGQRARELDAIHGNNRVMLILAGTFAGAGLVAMVLMVWFQSRAVHRLAEMSAALPSYRFAPAALPALVGPGETAVLASGPAEQSSSQLLSALARLEQRILELERLPLPQEQRAEPHAALADAAPGGSNGQGKSNGSGASPADGPRLDSLLAKGQALLNNDRAQEALECFEEVLSANPRHAEALVKKGTALEKLGKTDQAIECYDQAIGANSSLTIAYLHKGGLFNRLERFGEALECYEQALRTQEKRGSQA